MHEKQIETYFTRLAKSLDIFTVKLAPTEKGLPDRLVLHAGTAYFIEFKAADGKVSRAQKNTHEKLTRLGFSVFVCSSKQYARQLLFWIVEQGRK